MADEDRAPPPTQDSPPAEQAPASDQPPADVPVQLPELELEDHFRGGEPPPDIRMTVVEPKDVETKGN
jgi:hypothetical protein